MSHRKPLKPNREEKKAKQFDKLSAFFSVVLKAQNHTHPCSGKPVRMAFTEM